MAKPTTEETARALLVLRADMDQLDETAERIRMQVHTLCERHGVSTSLPSSP